MPSNDVSCPYDHLLIGDFGVRTHLPTNRIGPVASRAICILLVSGQELTLPNQNTESPILFRSRGHEPPFSDQKEASKIGDSVLCPNLSPKRRFGRATTSAVGNSPLILDESSDHGLGKRYEDIWMQSSGTGNLPGVIVPKTRPPGGTNAG
jgi:hypothetical protein